MAKKSVKVAKKSYGPTANLSAMGGMQLSANMAPMDSSSFPTVKYAPNPQLTAKMPADFEGINNQIKEEEILTSKKAPTVPAKPKPKKKVVKKKAAPVKKKASVKPGMTYMRKGADEGSVKYATANDKVKY